MFALRILQWRYSWSWCWSSLPPFFFTSLAFSLSLFLHFFFFFTVPPAIGHHMCVSTGDIASDLSTSRCLNCAREHPWAYARWDFSLCGLWPGGLRALLNPKEVKKEKKKHRGKMESCLESLIGSERQEGQRLPWAPARESRIRTCDEVIARLRQRGDGNRCTWWNTRWWNTRPHIGGN